MKTKTIVILLTTLDVVIQVTSVIQWELYGYRNDRPDDYYLTYTSDGTIDLITFDMLRATLNLDTEIDLIQTDNLTTVQGTTIIRLVEEYKGQRVRGSMIHVSMRPDGKIDRIGGQVAKGLGPALKLELRQCRLNKRQLLDIVFAYENESMPDSQVRRSRVSQEYQVTEGGEVIMLSTLDAVFVNKKAKTFERKVYRINACNSTVVDVENHTTTLYKSSLRNKEENYHQRVPAINLRARRKRQICNPAVTGLGGNLKTGAVQYGIPPNCLDLTQVNGICYLENDYIQLIDLTNTTYTEEEMTSPVQFPCNDGYNDTVNGAYSPALDTFHHATIALKMYREFYDYSPLTSPVPRAFVHVGEDLDNAFWDGQNILVGDGGVTTFPYCALDTIAHELGHGVAERSSGLEFRKQSGAIAESFADMAGEVTEVYSLGTNDWLVGADLFKEAGKVMRYFENPALDGVSIKHITEYKNNMPVHYASGLFNRVFYIVAQTLGVRLAFEPFLVASRIYWRETISFEEGACDVIQAAYDCGLDMDLYKQAFNDTGLKLNLCQDFSKFVLPIETSETKINLKASQVIQPLFKLKLPRIYSGVRASVSGADALMKVALMRTTSRDNAHTILSGWNRVSIFWNHQETLYVRLSAYQPRETPVTLHIAFF